MRAFMNRPGVFLQRESPRRDFRSHCSGQSIGLQTSKRKQEMKRSILTLLVFMSLFGSSLGVSSTKADSCPGSITVMNAADSGGGSLRQAIADICPEGTIV